MISGPHVENDGICAVWGGGVADDGGSEVEDLKIRSFSFFFSCVFSCKEEVCLYWFGLVCVGGFFLFFFFGELFWGSTSLEFSFDLLLFHASDVFGR